MISIESSKDFNIVHGIAVRDTSIGATIIDCIGIHYQPGDRYRGDISSQDFIFCFNAIQKIRNDSIDGLATLFS